MLDIVPFVILSPTIAITNVTQNANLTDFVIDYNAIDPDSNGKISLYYDTDNVGNDGILIANNIDENDGSGTFNWNTHGLATGTYYVYGMILDDNHNPVFSYANTPITISENADLEVTKTTNSDSIVIGQDLTYTVTVTNKGTTTSKGIKLLETLPETATFKSASLTPSETNVNNLTFNLGDLAAGASTTLTINVSPTVIGYIDSRSQITSSTYDPDYINNTVSAVVMGTEPSILAITATNATQTEGNEGTKAFTFTITRSSTIGDNSVDWAVTGIGTNPADATDFGGTLPSGTISFIEGENSKVITINVSGDTTVEPDENFTITLFNPTNGATITTAIATGTITNDDEDALPVISLAVNPVNVAEDAAINLVYTFTRTGPTGV